MKKIDTYIAIAKSFDIDHNIVETIAMGPEGKGSSLSDCQKWCAAANRNGFNYRPYPKESYEKD